MSSPYRTAGTPTDPPVNDDARNVGMDAAFAYYAAAMGNAAAGSPMSSGWVVRSALGLHAL